MQIPYEVERLFPACEKAGGRALMVGGSVRDACLGKSLREIKDIDIEVHRLQLTDLLAILKKFGRVDEVGKSFGVLKLRVKNWDLDVSIPRRDRQDGTKHTDIRAEADPFLGEVEAARRRDLTINAIGYDPLQKVFVDPFHGRRDLEQKILRAVDPETFVEDPLRALRVVQFAARFRFAVHPELEVLCREMPLHHLPAERIQGEVDKLLMKAKTPSVGWEFAERTGMWARVLPPWRRCPAALDAMAAQRSPAGGALEGGPRRGLMYAAACSEGTVEEAIQVMDRLKLHRWEGYRLRQQVVFLTGAWRAPGFSAADIRRMGDDGDLKLLSLLRDDPDLYARAQALGVAEGPLPPILLGRDLIALGLAPGTEMGELLKAARGLQLDGRLSTPEEAIGWARGQLGR